MRASAARGPEALARFCRYTCISVYSFHDFHDGTVSKTGRHVHTVERSRGGAWRVWTQSQNTHSEGETMNPIHTFTNPGRPRESRQGRRPAITLTSVRCGETETRLPCSCGRCAAGGGGAGGNEATRVGAAARRLARHASRTAPPCPSGRRPAGSRRVRSPSASSSRSPP